jgi:hypothetical protein
MEWTSTTERTKKENESEWLKKCADFLNQQKPGSQGGLPVTAITSFLTQELEEHLQNAENDEEREKIVKRNLRSFMRIVINDARFVFRGAGASRTVMVLNDPPSFDKMRPFVDKITTNLFRSAFSGEIPPSLNMEAEDMQAIIEDEDGGFALDHMELHDRVLFGSEMDPQGRGIVGYGLVKMSTSFYLSTRTIDILGELAVQLDGLKDNISSHIDERLLSQQERASLELDRALLKDHPWLSLLRTHKKAIRTADVLDLAVMFLQKTLDEKTTSTTETARRFT